MSWIWYSIRRFTWALFVSSFEINILIRGEGWWWWWFWSVISDRIFKVIARKVHLPLNFLSIYSNIDSEVVGHILLRYEVKLTFTLMCSFYSWNKDYSGCIFHICGLSNNISIRELNKVRAHFTSVCLKVYNISNS